MSSSSTGLKTDPIFAFLTALSISGKGAIKLRPSLARMDSASDVSSCHISIKASSDAGFRFRAKVRPDSDWAKSASLFIILWYSRTLSVFSFIIAPCDENSFLFNAAEKVTFGKTFVLYCLSIISKLFRQGGSGIIKCIAVGLNHRFRLLLGQAFQFQAP